MKSPVVVCAGIVTVDAVYLIEGALEEGLKHRASHSYLTTGGCALNAAHAIAFLGGQAFLSGVVGDDIFGKFVRDELRNLRIDGRYLTQRSGEATAHSAVLVDANGERTIINHRSENLYEIGAAQIDLQRVSGVLVDTRWPKGAVDLVEAARSAGIPCVVDAEAPVNHAAEALRGATHVAFSEQGLADFAGGADADALSRAAASLRAWVCVTRGSSSVLCHDGQTLSEVPAFKVKAVDTLGAGDVWHGAFTLALCEGYGELEAVRRANAAAALKTTRIGGGSPLPCKNEVENFLRETVSCH
jgi:sulfofructose kinase